MSRLLQRVQICEGVPSVGWVAVADVLGRLEGGEPPGKVAEGLKLEAADVIAALAFEGLGPEGSDGPTLVQTRPKRPGLAGAVAESGLAGLLFGTSRVERLILAAGLAQGLDFWDASHTAAQDADDLGERRVSAYWHGIAHRREPDSSNASYWFRRVGRHPLFGPLGSAAGDLIRQSGQPESTASLVPGGTWDPFAMIALCSRARPGSPIEILARRLQRLEMALLLDETISQLTVGESSPP